MNDFDKLADAYLSAEAGYWTSTRTLAYERAMAKVQIDKPTFAAIASTFEENPNTNNFRTLLGAMLAWQNATMNQD